MTYEMLAIAVLFLLLLFMTVFHMRLASNYEELFNRSVEIEDERDLALKQRDHINTQFEEQRTAFGRYRQLVANKGQADVRVQELTEANLALGEAVEGWEEFGLAVEEVLVDHIDGAALMKRVKILVDERSET